MLTLQQLESDIASGKSKMIYYSVHTQWWTHLDSDLAEATIIGRDFIRRTIQRKIDDPKTSTKERERIIALQKLVDSAKGNPPLDPTGSVCYQMDNPKKWIEGAKADPAFFGRHGLEALMLAHHQNCEGGIFKGWEGYNLLIDENKNI